MEELKGLEDIVIFNNKVNFELAKEKGLIKGQDASIYSMVQGLYLKVFEYLVQEKIDLKKYDDVIKNSGLDFGVIPKEKKNFFHQLSYLGLDYIYIRNFFFIEKLSQNDLSVFLDKINKEDFEVSDDLISIVIKTYKDVIQDNFVQGVYKDITTACYGAWTEENLSTSDKLAISIQYGLNTHKLELDDYIDNSLKKRELINKISDELSMEFKNKFDVDLKILVRDINGE